jgi:hypothetical protein
MQGETGWSIHDEKVLIAIFLLFGRNKHSFKMRQKHDDLRFFYNQYIYLSIFKAIQIRENIFYRA